MYLHEAIIKLLELRGRSMSTSEIAAELNRNQWYTKKDGSNITAFQIHGRTRNYSHLFRRDGSLVSLVDQPITIVKVKYPRVAKIDEIKTAREIPKSLEAKLMDKSKFRSAGDIDYIVPSVPGLYCIGIRDAHKLPAPFSTELAKRRHIIIYIGKASQSLHRRFLGQELRARGHGTFFRSMGCVLGFRPPKGSLAHKKNKNNFKFRPEDEIKIIKWINENLLVNWIEYNGEVRDIESELILKYKPLLNLDGNPYALDKLKTLRSMCKQIANTEN